MNSATAPAPGPTAVLLIAHGSRREEANLELGRLAQLIRERGGWPIVEIAYLELAQPAIPDGARTCVERNAARVLMLPYFLSYGAHVVDDLEGFRRDLAALYPAVRFTLCRPLAAHPLLLEIVIDRLHEAADSSTV